MICIKANISKELSDINDGLKAIYHSKNTIFFFIFKGMAKVGQENIYQEYQS